MEKPRALPERTRRALLRLQRYFYQYELPRPLAEIVAYIWALETEGLPSQIMEA